MLGRDLGGHVVQLEDRGLELGERDGVRRRDVSAVGLALPAAVVDAVAVRVGLEGVQAQLLGQREDAVLPGPGPLSSELDDVRAARQPAVEVAAADAVTRLQDDHRMPRPLDRARGRQSREPSADHHDVVAMHLPAVATARARRL